MAEATGIIPACAGNTAQPAAPLQIFGDHPRVCGEHRPGEADNGRARGSSPRVRGTPFLTRAFAVTSWIIPACAGNTAQLHHHYRHSVGSSPRVRGTRLAGAQHQTENGIIPACAGNTPSRRRTGGSPRDHPRVCGEHKIGGFFQSAAQGSSPRVRGTLLPLALGGGDAGIIPACAGNTGSVLSCCANAGDHPRVCGEHRPWHFG